MVSTDAQTDKPKSPAELRKFGLVMAVPLSLIAAYLWWKGHGVWTYLAGAAVLLAVLGLVAPGSLRQVEKGWMAFSLVLGAIMTRVILTLTFYLVFTPLGLFLRLIGKDLLKLKFEPERTSYWELIEKDGPSTRPDKPY